MGQSKLARGTELVLGLLRANFIAGAAYRDCLIDLVTVLTAKMEI